MVKLLMVHAGGDDGLDPLAYFELLVAAGRSVHKAMVLSHYLLSKLDCIKSSSLLFHVISSNRTDRDLNILLQHISTTSFHSSKKIGVTHFLLASIILFISLNSTIASVNNRYIECVTTIKYSYLPHIICIWIETYPVNMIIFLSECSSCARYIYNFYISVHHVLKHKCMASMFSTKCIHLSRKTKTDFIPNVQVYVLDEVATMSTVVNPVGPTRIAEMDERKAKLTELQQSLADGEKPLPQLVNCCKTYDQAKALLKMVDMLTEKRGRATVSLTAGRGRGKSATLGLAVAAAVHFGLNNIFVTSPSPENLGTFFEFVFKGFDALDMQEETDYEIMQSTNTEFGNAIVRINIFREHRQIIQYIQPSDQEKLAQAELVVIDEAAAIPLPQVKALIGQYNVLMASTINGYEGTGRSLSLKLLNQLRQQSVLSGSTATKSASLEASAPACRTLHEVELEESVRYSNDDPIELWLYKLLCLDTSNTQTSTCPPPQNCQLYYVNRNVLFSGHPESEEFLSQVMSLLVASHYRNSPDDLSILADAPAHHLFVLLPPVPQGGTTTNLPTVLSIIQVCVEGGIPKKVSSQHKDRGERPSGDLIPWTLASQFLKTKLTEMVGLRVVRIATHPDYQSMGYGSQALTQLKEYYSGKHLLIEEDIPETSKQVQNTNGDESSGRIEPCKNEEPLLLKLSERTPESLDYLSVSYGITKPLLKFWAKAGFIPIYISQASNKVTGEHSCAMTWPIGWRTEDLEESVIPWLGNCGQEFLHRFLALSGGPLKDLEPTLALAVINAVQKTITKEQLSWREIKTLISGHDIQRLEKYSKNLADRHLITDLLPAIAQLFFSQKLPSVHLSGIQSGLLLGMGLQFSTVDHVSSQLVLPIESALGQFNRMMRRILSALQGSQETALGQHIPVAKPVEFTPVDISLSQDLEEAAADFDRGEQMNRAPVTSSKLGDLSKYAITGDDTEWENALKDGIAPGSISMKSKKRPAKMTEEELERELEGPTKKKKNKKKK
ncbi:unnamed protein product, partial [Meganyctiphanes norvegica]